MHCKRIVLAVLLGLLLAVAGPAQAETLSHRFQKFLTSDLYQMLITSKWDQQARLICGDNAGRSNLGLGQLVEVAPVRGTSKKPTSGAWIHRVPGYTCGKRRTFNFLVKFGSDGPLFVTLLPGDTLAKPLLQKHALEVATQIVQLKVKECGFPLIVDTLQGGPIPGVPGGWIEHWYFDACGQIVVESVIFAPDGNGGTTFQAR